MAPPESAAGDSGAVPSGNVTSSMGTGVSGLKVEDMEGPGRKEGLNEGRGGDHATGRHYRTKVVVTQVWALMHPEPQYSPKKEPRIWEVCNNLLRNVARTAKSCT